MIKIGLVGYGFMGKMHAQCYRAACAQIVSVADVSADRRSEAEADLGCKAFDSVAALLNGPAVDAVDISTPTFLHEEQVLAAINAGKDVLCEKPLALTNASCDRIVSAAQAAGVRLMAGHVVRFWPESLVMKEVLDSGRLGMPIWASARRLSSPGTWSWQGWIRDPAKTGGVVLDLHIHDLDFLTWILGRPKQVSSTAVKNADGSRDPVFTTLIGHANAQCSYAEGCFVMPEGFPFTSQMLVVCEKGSISFDMGGSPTLIVRPSGAPEEHPEIPTPVPGGASAGGNISSLGGYYNEIAYFLDCISANKQPEILTPEEAAYAVRLCLAAAESAETGRIVAVG